MFSHCGSGKKYKKCCIDKNIDFKNPIKKVKNKEIDDKLLYIYHNKSNMKPSEIIDNYLDIMNFFLDYAKTNNIRNVEVLDKEGFISESVYNVIEDFELELENINDYDFDLIFDYLDRIVDTFDLIYNSY